MTRQPYLVAVRELFDGSRRFRVPIYQRAYAWGEVEIETLFRDIVSVLDRPHYYIGSLVIHEVRDVDSAQPLFDVIDGQQRLTTLFIALAHPALRAHLKGLPTPFEISDTLLTFEERKRSNLDLATLSRPGVTRNAVDLLHDEGIKSGAEIIGNILEDDKRLQRQLAEARVSRHWSTSGSQGILPDVLECLLDRVKVVATELPRDTDLNHYFEVMNTRGEQLEKHEIVKAHLLGLIGEDASNRALFSTVWDACSDFSRHVQSRFDPPVRSVIFGDPNITPPEDAWSSLAPTDVKELAAALDSVPASLPATGPDLDQLLTGPEELQMHSSRAAVEDSDAGRYGAIIDFPNFLLHALRLSVSDHRAISLDDKKLVTQFKSTVKDAASALDFAFRLLRAKFLFDNFVIKPLGDQGASDDSNWVVHRQHRTRPEAKSEKLTPRNAFGNHNAQVLMLQAMYQVTHQRRVYKEFLYEILSWLDGCWASDRRIDGEAFIRHMHRMADQDLAALELDHGRGLDAGTGVPHFAFNLLDYKLWLFSERKRGVLQPDLPEVEVAASGFRFAYRSSIEHFLPLNLAEGEDRMVADHLGNLCLMTREENSRRSDHTPDWKVAKYGTTNQSLKFKFMAELQRREGWHAAQISQQGMAMRRVLLTRLNGVAEDPLLAGAI